MNNQNIKNNVNQELRGEVGWICPVCGRGCAPHLSFCPCKGPETSITYLNTNPNVDLGSTGVPIIYEGITTARNTATQTRMDDKYPDSFF